MQASLIFGLLLSVSGVLGQKTVTCVEAPVPRVGIETQGVCGVWGDRRTQCSSGPDTLVWYSPPKGNSAGVLKVQNAVVGTRKIVQLRGPEDQTKNFWINGGDECVTNVRMANVRSYAVYNIV